MQISEREGSNVRRVSCYECGRHYDYDDDGFCPHCGAFNQPPKKVGFSAAGTLVNYAEGINERNHARSFVHKELHSENRARRGTELDRSASTFRERVAQSRSFAGSEAKGGVKLDPKVLRWLIVAGVWLAAMIFGLISD